ncbi:hypothetical protein HFO02_36035 [Rhizobium laguerreae]|uniref:general secretion pathway protein GspK n=1 Tax=Rhizobium laguerreae TaxID=1076926 RepID=UPI001C91F424|nr:type II secretion system protein GspK [Rhizobium laguerreae]MBY3328890.1 hypothetical protein [Rhizobium laguerreae]
MNLALSRLFDSNPCDRHSESASAGFAIVLVLWIIGLISVIVFAISWTTRVKVQISRNIVETTYAEKMADAAISLVQVAMLEAASANDERDSETPALQRPTLCSLSNALAVIAVENEGGKVDLNAASVDTLAALFEGIGASPVGAQNIANAVDEFRRVSIESPKLPSSENLPPDRAAPPKRAPFDTILELDQVRGMHRDIFEAALPFVTVAGHRDHPNLDLSPPALRAALTGAPAINVEQIGRQAAVVTPLAGNLLSPTSFGRVTIGERYLVHVETLTVEGGYFVREANMELLAGRLHPRVTEWRRGRERYRSALKTASGQLSGKAQGSYPDCGPSL